MKMKLGIILILTVVTVLLSIPQKTVALPRSTRLQDFYSNANFIELVGTKFTTCSGVGSLMGSTSSYYVIERDACEGGFCYITCTPSPCPSHILANYPCPEL
jgi:hypothetical protein